MVSDLTEEANAIDQMYDDFMREYKMEIQCWKEVVNAEIYTFVLEKRKIDIDIYKRFNIRKVKDEIQFIIDEFMIFLEDPEEFEDETFKIDEDFYITGSSLRVIQGIREEMEDELTIDKIEIRGNDFFISREDEEITVDYITELTGFTPVPIFSCQKEFNEALIERLIVLSWFLQIFDVKKVILHKSLSIEHGDKACFIVEQYGMGAEIEICGGCDCCYE